MLKVTNPATNRSVIVRVTDRGPFVRGRIIDLSWRAAKEIGMLAQGIAYVIVEVVTNYVVPFRPDEKTYLPDFELGSTDYDYAIPKAWKKYLDLSEDNDSIARKAR